MGETRIKEEKMKCSKCGSEMVLSLRYLKCPRCETERCFGMMTEEERKEELREEIFNLVTDPPCPGCGFWDYQGHSCFLGSMHEGTKKCGLLNQILATGRKG